MSSVETSPLGVNKSILNNSKSKAMYSFPKDQRFQKLQESCENFYEKPSMLDKRSTSFGYGKKSDILNESKNNPSPDKYTMKSQFQMTKTKGISLGLGRDDCKNVSIFSNFKSPAPGDYKTETKQNTPIYSIRRKLDLPELFPNRKTPGPGQYQAQKIDSNGFAYNSKYKTNVSYKIHNKSLQRKGFQLPKALGPMTYNTIVPSTGKQLLSKKKTQQSFYFDKKPRVTLHIDSISPGPGNYSFFSQFGK